jgi:hypothetical protein
MYTGNAATLVNEASDLARHVSTSSSETVYSLVDFIGSNRREPGSLQRMAGQWVYSWEPTGLKFSSSSSSSSHFISRFETGRLKYSMFQKELYNFESV